MTGVQTCALPIYSGAKDLPENGSFRCGVISLVNADGTPEYAYLNYRLRARAVGKLSPRVPKTSYSTGDQMIHLAGGDLLRTEVRDTYRYQPVQLVQRVLDLMQVTVSPETRQALDDYATTAPYGDRHHLIRLVMHTPDLHMA